MASYHPKEDGATQHNQRFPPHVPGQLRSDDLEADTIGTIQHNQHLEKKAGYKHGPNFAGEHDQAFENPDCIKRDADLGCVKITSDGLSERDTDLGSEDTKTSDGLRQLPSRNSTEGSTLAIRQITSRISIGSHSYYNDGEPRTLLRGWLHGFLSMAGFVVLIVLMVALFLQKLPLRWISAGCFLVGKLTSYIASSTLHLFQFQTKQAERLALQFDLAMIPVSIAVTPIPFTLELVECMVSSATHAIFIALGAVAISYRWKVARLALIVTHFFVAVFQVGVHAGSHSPLWLTGVISYSLGFVAYKIGRHPELTWRMPWHRIAWYGWHDDFHVLLFVGDLLIAVQGVLLLSDPDQDQKPSWWFSE